ncbi:MAG: exo-alpha-sialidase [Zoogloeaceae bacterium]|jgi:hypothetical protein|nr:exo-alpha-sialidase [Zoogloeaceae bacterium]
MTNGLMAIVMVAGLAVALAAFPLLVHGGEIKLVCEFDDGDRIIIRQKYEIQPLRLFYREAHGLRRYIGDAHAFYKPKGKTEERERVDWFSLRGGDFSGEYDRIRYCSSFRKINGVITTEASYKLPGMDWKKIPYVVPYNVSSFPEEVKKKMDDMRMKPIWAGGTSLAQINVSTFLYEAPLRYFRPNPNNPLVGDYEKNIEAVLQSYSYDGGQTWTPLELTQDSKLYELGKMLFEQKGVARPVDWTK